MSSRHKRKQLNHTEQLVETILECLAELVYNSQAEEQINQLLQRMQVYNPLTYIQPRKLSYQVHTKRKISTHNFTPGFEHSVNEAFAKVLTLYNGNRSLICRVAKLAGSKMAGWCKGDITAITPLEAYRLAKATGYQVLPWELCPEIKTRNRPIDSKMTHDFLFQE